METATTVSTYIENKQKITGIQCIVDCPVNWTKRWVD